MSTSDDDEESTIRVQRGRGGITRREPRLPPAREPLRLRLPDGREVLFEEVFTIGRDPDNLISLPDDDYVSARHCRIFPISDLPVVEDLSSTNGTWLNGARVPIGFLQLGARLKIGQTVMEVVAGPGETLPQTRFVDLIGNSPRMRTLYAQIEKIAPNALTVLILGESGTGKELVARALHEKSGRKGRFVPLNCAGLPSNLIESELFGHEKGAFTGAKTQKLGLFEEADGGTLFLDEIGDLPLDLQPKLLRMLELHSVRTVGGRTERKLDVRIVAATNYDLSTPVDPTKPSGPLRPDLYHRLSTIKLFLPPLRERRDDLPRLVAHFLETTGKLLSPQAWSKVNAYHWPGNVRELERRLSCAVALGGDVLECADLFPPRPDRSTTAKEQSATGEDAYEIDLLEAVRVHGNPHAAARALNISPSTVYDRLRRDPRFDASSAPRKRRRK